MSAYTLDQFPGHRKTIAAAVSAAIAGIYPSQVASEGLEQITVTATKREQSLQDIPIAVTAFSDAEIVREGFKQLEDYVGEIPALEANKRAPGSTTLVMRGCATSGTGFADNPTTAIYMDENPISAGGVNPDPRLIDINRVESLSGPQGNLFGVASQCGTLRIITNKPDTDSFDGWIDATPFDGIDDAGDTGGEISSMVNIPLVEGKLGLRLIGFWSEEAGYIDNVLRDSPGTILEDGDEDLLAMQDPAFNNADNVEDDINSSTTKGARASLRWTPNDTWLVDAVANWQGLESDGYGDVDTNRGIHADRGYDIGDLEQVRFNDEAWKDEWYQLSLTTEAKTSVADFTVTGAYLKRDTRYDADATTYQISVFETEFSSVYAARYDFGFNRGTGRVAGDTRGDNADELTSQRWTFEARMATPADSDSRWSGIVGLFYANKDENEVFKSNIRGISNRCDGGDNIIVGDLDLYTYNSGDRFYNRKGSYANGCAYGTKYLLTYQYAQTGLYEANDNWFAGYYDEQFREKAIFGEVAFDITDRFTLTAGGRWFEYDQTRTNVRSFLQGTEVDVDEAVPVCGSEDEIENGLAEDYCSTFGTFENTENGWVPKVNLTYRHSDDKLIYVTYSEGFRRGGVNGARNGEFAPDGSQFTYDSDTLSNFEAGFKTSWLDDSFRFNLTAYHMIWDNIIIETRDPTSFTVGNVNLTEAEIDGIEASFAWSPTDLWDIRGTIGYNDAETSEASTIFAGSVAELSIGEGERLPISPRIKTSLKIAYTFQQRILGAEPYITGTWLHQGDSLNSLGGLGTGGGTQLNDVLVHDAFSLLNLRAGLEGDKWSATAYITNLTDRRGELFFDPNRQPERLSVSQPRTFGINFRRYFGE